MTKVQEKIVRNKELMLEQLKKIPIVQIAAEKVGIGRSSYYRWLKDDLEFAEKAEAAVRDGRWLINEMAESQLLKQVRENNMTAIIYWLKHNHPIYSNRLEITTRQVDDKTPLTEEQQQAIAKALELGMLQLEEGQNE